MPVPARKTTDSYKGQHAIRLLSGSNSMGVLLFGKIKQDGTQVRVDANGVPFTKRPVGFKFAYKYLPANNDSARVTVALSKWNDTTNEKIIVAKQEVYLIGETSTYQEKLLRLNYQSGLKPDTAMVFFRASAGEQGIPGTELFLDDIHFTNQSQPSGKPMVAKTKAKVNVYPNPAVNEVKVKLTMNDHNTEAGLRIFNSNGVTVKATGLEEGINRIKTAGMATGIYHYECISSDGNLMKSGKFMVVN